MKKETENSLTLFVNNSNELKPIAKWDYTVFRHLAALLCTMKGESVSAEQVKAVKRMIKEQAGVFSRFRSNFQLPCAALLSTSHGYDDLFSRSLDFYEELKEKGFRGSNYLLISSVLVAENHVTSDFSNIAAKSMDIYKAMNDAHKLLTGEKSYSIAISLALSEQNPLNIMTQGEENFQTLKSFFSNNNATLSLSYLLALGNGRNEIYCQKAMDLYDALKSRGQKFGKNHELTALAGLCFLDESPHILADEIIEIAEALKNQKGFGPWSLNKAQRLLFAAAIKLYAVKSTDTALTLAIAASTTAVIIATEAAVIAAIAASSAAIAASSSSN